MTSRGGVSREAILRDNQEIMLDGGAKHLSWGHVALRIPKADRRALSHRYPELDSTDWETQTRAWKRFAASSESKPYRVVKPKYHGQKST